MWNRAWKRYKNLPKISYILVHNCSIERRAICVCSREFLEFGRFDYEEREGIFDFFKNVFDEKLFSLWIEKLRGKVFVCPEQMKYLVSEFIQKQRLKKVVVMNAFEFLKEHTDDTNICSLVLVEGAYCNKINYWIITINSKIHMQITVINPIF